MKAKNLSPVMRGISAAMASVLALAVTGTSVADTYRTNVDDVLGTQSYVTSSDKESARFKSDYATIEDMMAAAKDIAIREGEIPQPGEKVYIHVETEKLHLFDRGTEKSLGYPEMVIRAQEKLAVPKLEKAIAQ